MIGLIFLSTIECAQPTQVKFDHLTVEDGLTSGSINDIIQDSRGFMWFGTNSGLNRYDGYEVKFYNSISVGDEKSQSLFVTSLIEDGKNNIWFGTKSGGVSKLDRKTELFSHYYHDPEDSNSLSNQYVNDIYEDSQGIIWIGTEHGLNRFNPEDNTFTSYYHDPEDSASINDDRITVLHEYPTGTLWAGTRKGTLIRKIYQMMRLPILLMIILVQREREQI